MKKIDRDMKILAIGSASVAVLLAFVAINNSINDEGSLDFFEVPMAYAHFADDFPLECGLIPDLEQCDKSFTHQIRDLIYDFLFNFFADQINPIS